MKPASIAITAATGQLGLRVIDQLLKVVPASAVVAVVRNPAKAAALAERGVTVRAADYDDAAALVSAFAGIEKLLLISSSEIGKRVAQHRNAIAAAKTAGVGLIAYTSVLRADTSPLSLAAEHVATEHDIRASGLPFVILRNGWYAENYAASIASALAHGAFVGSAGAGRISGASRADYAAAAVAALTGRAETGRAYELAGDVAFTLADFAAEISRQTGRAIPYVDLPVPEYQDLLRKAGLPEPLAAGLPQWDADASRGALFEDGGELGRLIGHPTTPLADTIREALAALPPTKA